MCKTLACGDVAETGELGGQIVGLPAGVATSPWPGHTRAGERAVGQGVVDQESADADGDEDQCKRRHADGEGETEAVHRCAPRMGKMHITLRHECRHAVRRVSQKCRSSDGHSAATGG